MARAFVGVGSNIDPENNVAKAVRLLMMYVRVCKISTVYLTRPIGRPEQPPYYNCVLQAETDLSPLELKRSVLRRIEEELGRKREKDKSAPRTIDLDLLLYDDVILRTEDLTLPDPDIRRRPFLAFALYELAPDLIMPNTGDPLSKIVSAMPRDTMKPLAAYTNRLKREITS